MFASLCSLQLPRSCYVSRLQAWPKGLVYLGSRRGSAWQEELIQCVPELPGDWKGFSILEPLPLSSQHFGEPTVGPFRTSDSILNDEDHCCLL